MHKIVETLHIRWEVEGRDSLGHSRQASCRISREVPLS